MRHWLALLTVIAVCTTTVHVNAWEYEGKKGTVSFDANALTHLLYLATPAFGGEEATDSALAIQRIRPKFAFTVSHWLSFEASWDLMPVVGNALDATQWAVASANPLRLVDADEELHAGDGWKLRHNLDRLVFRFTHDAFELRLGRQAIGHGSARIFSSADLFANVSPASLDSEFKRGVDGVRLTIPIGETMEVEFYAIFKGDDFEQSLYLARWRATLGTIDLSIIAGSSYAKPTLAFDLSGDILGAGWYLEGSARIDTNDDDKDSSLRLTLGFDYKFSFGLQLTLEGHYNSPGEAEPGQFLKAFTSLSRTVGESFLVGRWYVGLGLGYELSALIQARVAWMQSLTDGSALATIAIAWDFTENVAIEVGAMLPIGKRTRMQALIPEPRSEFGLYPFMGFTALRLAL